MCSSDLAAPAADLAADPVPAAGGSKSTDTATAAATAGGSKSTDTNTNTDTADAAVPADAASDDGKPASDDNSGDMCSVTFLDFATGKDC